MFKHECEPKYCITSFATKHACLVYFGLKILQRTCSQPCTARFPSYNRVHKKQGPITQQDRRDTNPQCADDAFPVVQTRALHHQVRGVDKQMYLEKLYMLIPRNIT